MIADNVIHECGNRADGAQDHAIYFDNSANALVTSNVIWGTAGYAIHLYQNAQGTQILKNVIDHNGFGVIFAGSSEFASSDNTVAGNLITNTTSGYDVTSWWSAAAGTRNVLRENCIYRGRLGTIDKLDGGFTAFRNVIANARYVDAQATQVRAESEQPLRLSRRVPRGARGLTAITAERCVPDQRLVEVSESRCD